METTFAITVGQPPNNTLKITPGETLVDPIMFTSSGNGGIQLDSSLAIVGDLVATEQYVDASVAAPVMGVTDGTDAQPGEIGEYLSVSNVAGLAMAANRPLAVCTMPLPPGCWEVWGACDFTVLSTGADELAAPIQPNQLGASISTHPDALPTEDDLIVGTGVMNLIYSPLAPGQRQVLITGQCRSNSVDPLDLYLVAQIGLGNVNVKGYVSARRVR